MPASVDTAEGRACARCGRLMTRYANSWRCKPCRSKERVKQKRAQEERAEIAKLANGDDGGEEYGDEWRLWVASGEVTLTDAQLREARPIFVTGHARTILDRTGVSVRRFALNAGVTPRAALFWVNNATMPKSAKNWPAAAWGILLLKDLVDEEDLELTAHGLKPGADSWKSFNPHPPHDLPMDTRVKVCDGCKVARQQQTCLYN